MSTHLATSGSTMLCVRHKSALNRHLAFLSVDFPAYTLDTPDRVPNISNTCVVLHTIGITEGDIIANRNDDDFDNDGDENDIQKGLAE